MIFLESVGFKSGVASPCVFYNKEREIRVVVHGDDSRGLRPDSADPFLFDLARVCAIAEPLATCMGVVARLVDACVSVCRCGFYVGFCRFRVISFTSISTSTSTDISIITY